MSTRSLDSIRTECRDESIHCFATFAIFERRARSFRKWLQGLTFLGIVVPASVGSAFTAYGAGSKVTLVLLSIASVLGFIQLVGSIWSLTSKWDDSFAYAQESMSSNRSLSERFRALADNPPTRDEAGARYELLQTESQARSTSDDKQGVSEAEKRFGMRAALRQSQRTCVRCGSVPYDMQPTDCPVCGNFPSSWSH
jgi:mobilome CxxCx(11)CxxC protein